MGSNIGYNFKDRQKPRLMPSSWYQLNVMRKVKGNQKVRLDESNFFKIKSCLMFKFLIYLECVLKPFLTNDTALMATEFRFFKFMENICEVCIYRV